jgi:hypothetical protein
MYINKYTIRIKRDDRMVNIKKYIKYIIFGSFIGILLIYLHFKKVNVK